MSHIKSKLDHTPQHFKWSTSVLNIVLSPAVGDQLTLSANATGPGKILSLFIARLNPWKNVLLCQRGTSAPRRSTFGAPNWGRNITY